MWILPRQILESSRYARGTEALTSDSDEFCHLAAQSLLVKSKPTPSQTISKKLRKGDAVIRFLFGRTLKHSHWKSFQKAMRLRNSVGRASHSRYPARSEQTKTLDTFSPI